MALEEIKEQVKSVIQYSQGIEDPKVDKLIDDWYKAKEDFISMMGNKFIYEFPNTFTFTLNDSVKKDKLEEFADQCGYKYGNYDLSNFIKDMSLDFFTNTTSKEYHYNDVTIPKGMKIVKAFKYFEKDKEVLQALQMAASRVIQEDKISGKLCISVHPLDFLSSSENIHNWRSCHALDGDYRAGNLSYMLDSSTVICYLKSEQDEIIPNFPEDLKWNSKKWRVLLHFSEDMMMVFAGRQYPFTSDCGLDLLRTKMAECFGFEWTKWDNHVIDSFSFNDGEKRLTCKYYNIGNSLLSLGDLMKDNSELHYNDVLRSTCYRKPQYSYRINRFNRQAPGYSNTLYTKFSVGSKVKCLQCGEEEITMGSIMRCLSCEEKYGTEINEDWGFCDGCGRRIYLNDAYWVHGDLCVCEQCFENEYAQCDICGEYFYKEEIVYDRDSELYLCESCRGSEEEYYG